MAASRSGADTEILGVPGHQNVQITGKHYAPLQRARQKQP
jgi:hypothetical protein